MDVAELAAHVGIAHKEMTHFLRRVEQGLGTWDKGRRRTFTTTQAEQIRLAYWQSTNRRTR